jgi:multidrug resistance efflux pump
MMEMVVRILRSGMVRAGLLVVLVVGVLAGGGVFFLGGRGGRASDSPGEEPADEPVFSAVPVKAVRPRRDERFAMTVRRPADVEAYYSTHLESRVPGVVSMIRTAIGEEVKKGELLIRVDVPDLVQTLNEKERTVTQRRRDYELAVANIHTAEAAVKTARSDVKLKQAAVVLAEATLAHRHKLLLRLQDLRAGRTIAQGVVDDAQRDYEAALAEKQSALAAVEKAQAGVEDALAQLEAARAQAQVKDALVAVAQCDRDLARAMLDYTSIRAPFDSVVVHRNVDPGSFVQNASSGHPTPLLSLERTDIVTVVMRVPDNYAPYVTPGTEAVLELDALPGVQIHGRVTRFAPSLVTSEHDRTMRVEVDLWNRGARQFQEFLAGQRAKKEPFDDLKKGPLPLVPEFKGKGGAKAPPRLMPGMFGRMTLVLQQFQGSHLVPSSAVVSHGGRPYIYVVRDGTAHLQPVEEDVNDGKLAKVELLDADGSVAGDLTGDEVVIISNQGELSEGVEVKPTLVEDWGNAAARAR